MEASFWHDRWRENRIGFHANAPNQLLEQNFHVLGLPQGSRIFLPLCGKTLDIGWFLSQGHRVVGVELSQTAIEQLFNDLDVTPEITIVGALQRYSAPDLDIYVGDIFDLSMAELGAVDLIYDRAALVALPAEMRMKYAVHMIEITQKARQFLLCFEYDQTLMDGPPFSITEQEVRKLYSGSYDIALAERAKVAGGFKGKIPATEAVWLLQG